MEQLGNKLGTAVSPLYTRSPLILNHDARLRHTFVLGQTGTGKTTLLQQMAINDLNDGNGFAFLDPHGDAAQELLDYIPPERTRDIVYLRPGDTDCAFGFNLFHGVAPHEKDRLTQEVVATFRYRWSDSWGARMENLFKHSVRALLDLPQNQTATLLSLPLILNSEDYRAWVLSHCDSHAVHQYFKDEYGKWPARQQAEWAQPILNKVDTFLLSDALRNIIGQRKSTIDIDYIMNNQKVLILDLDKGAIGQDDANTIGSLFVTAFQMAAMRRPRELRSPFYCYLDEFHSFTTGSFASIMSESRKYGLGLILAGQYLDQIEHDQVQHSVFGNCGNFISFRVGNKDAQFIAPTLDRQPERLEELPMGNAIVRHLNNGEPQTTHLETERLHRRNFVRRSKRVKRYSQRYTRDVTEITDAHLRWIKSLKSLEVKPGKWSPHGRNRKRGACKR